MRRIGGAWVEEELHACNSRMVMTARPKVVEFVESFQSFIQISSCAKGCVNADNDLGSRIAISLF